MNTQQNDGGPAFPSAGYSGGMSLRAYYVGQALGGIATHLDRWSHNIDAAGAEAVALADAALRALNAAPTCKPDLQVEEKKDVCVWEDKRKGVGRWVGNCGFILSHKPRGYCGRCGRPVQIGGGE